MWKFLLALVAVLACAAIAKLISILTAQSPEAMGLLGSMHFLGMGVPSDGKRAVELLQGAAGRGDGRRTCGCR